jgi:hypothetical protein
MKTTYSYCLICGSEPTGELTSPMNILCRFWCPDDGWRIGALCVYCHRDCADRKPEPSDYAYDRHRGDCCSTIDPETDEDVLYVL